MYMFIYKENVTESTSLTYETDTSLMCSVKPEVDVNSLINVTMTGSDLWCLTCTETYKRTFDPSNSPCLNNVSKVTIARCGTESKYCKVSTDLF